MVALSMPFVEIDKAKPPGRAPYCQVGQDDATVERHPSQSILGVPAVPEELMPKDLKEDLQSLIDVTDVVRKKQDWHSWAQFVIAAFAVASTVISAFNNWRLEKNKDAIDKVDRAQVSLKEKQDDLARKISQQQVDSALSTSVLHEAMLILDTPSEAIRTKKSIFQILLLNSLAQQYQQNACDHPDEIDPTRQFYKNLIAKLSADLPGTPEALEVKSYVSFQVTAECRAEPVVTSPARVATANPTLAWTPSPPASPTPSPAVVPPPAALAVPAPQAVIKEPGEATVQGPAQGWDYDVFWCVNNTPYPQVNPNKDIAETIFRDLVARQQRAGQQAIGRVRLRRLPDIVNRSSDYSVAVDHVSIRSTAQKRGQAEELKQWIQARLGTKPVRIDPGTPGLNDYLSVFVCTEAT